MWEGVLFFVSQVVVFIGFCGFHLTNCNFKLQVCHAMLCSVVVCCGLLRCKVVSYSVVCCGVLRSALVCHQLWCAALCGGGGGGGSVLWSHDVPCGVLCCHVVRPGVMWCGPVSCGVVWCGAMGYRAIRLLVWFVEWCVGCLAGWVVWQLGLFVGCLASWGMLCGVCTLWCLVPYAVVCFVMSCLWVPM